VAFAVCRAAPAGAWEIQDPIHANCHERLTQAALTEVGYVAPPPALSGDDAALPANLEFPAGAYDGNIDALSLIIGVRWPDEHGSSDFSLYNQATYANDPTLQSEHCLRRETDEGSAGDAAAVGACRAYIEQEYWAALSSLDAQGNVDARAREPATFYTAFQGTIDYPLVAFYFHAGRGLHAVQDSFTHTFRTPDRRHIVSVANWVDAIRCTLDERSDGHPHEGRFDLCDPDDDPNQKDRYAAALLASKELLRGLTSRGTHAERSARLDAFFEHWMTYQPGCTLEDAYCGNADYAWVSQGGRSDAGSCHSLFGCGVPGGHRSGAPAIVALALGGIVLLRRRRRLAGAWVAVALSAWPHEARAEPDGRGFKIEARTSLSVDRPAYAFGAAGMYAWARADLGLFAELNPWYSVERNTMTLGTTNFGILSHFLLPLRSDLRLRFGAGLGFAVLNEPMIGTNAGKIGPYANVRLVGLVWQLRDKVALTVDPFDLALPAPQMTGWPILYTQHRASVGLAFGW
jgi:hypothetical protein